MAYKSRECDYHLTPGGWTTEVIASTYTVETWRLSVYQEFPWSKEQRAWSRIWHSLAWSEVERDRLRQTYPPPVDQTPAAQTSTANTAPNECQPRVRRSAG
jgi:hypothetical protein